MKTEFESITTGLFLKTIPKAENRQTEELGEDEKADGQTNGRKDRQTLIVLYITIGD